MTKTNSMTETIYGHHRMVGKTVKTGNNEYTTYSDYDVVVTYHRTAIVTLNLQTQTVTLNTGGYLTVSTITHMNKAIDRLSDTYDWVPHAKVSGAGGFLTVRAAYNVNTFQGADKVIHDSSWVV